jgi:hypothetical protein
VRTLLNGGRTPRTADIGGRRADEVPPPRAPGGPPFGAVSFDTSSRTGAWKPIIHYVGTSA